MGSGNASMANLASQICNHIASHLLQTHYSAFDLMIAELPSSIASQKNASFSMDGTIPRDRVLLLTAQPESRSSVKHANVVAFVPAQTMADDKEDVGGEKSRTLLPMWSAYEGAMFVLFEMVMYKLGEVLGESSEAIRARHTNLE
ncbi:hypothetical protein CRYUN_Cryun19dG0077700 [Craigia yunnanensis]